jgi:tRNA-specific 2-thiouridylase
MKALALLSGGLDSTLAIRVVLDQGIDVEAINFVTPFCLCSGKTGCGSHAKKTTERLGLRLRLINIGNEFIERVKSPKYGYGKNLNPCIDCRILMHIKAKACMTSMGASFIITGEVLGQRPKSQHRSALTTIERESGLEGLILRPLSAKLLPPTIPERKGWIDRSQLLEISGRSRKPQMALAASHGIVDYPCPAGGCLLTDPVFSQKVKDLMAFSELNVRNIHLLKVGRHFRLSPRAKIVVGRNKEENQRLLALTGPGDVCLEPLKVMGPVALVRGEAHQVTIEKGARIVARYCDDAVGSDIDITSRKIPDGGKQTIRVRPTTIAELERLRIHAA